jgi:hypothetical protein
MAHIQLRTLIGPMSALGQKQTFAAQNGMSALHLKADMCDTRMDVCLCQ